MLTLLIGFICLVLAPAIVLAVVLNWLSKRSDKTFAKKDDFKFTM
jgi:hypothetical protein